MKTSSPTKTKKLPHKPVATNKAKKSSEDFKKNSNLFFLGLTGAAVLASTLLTLSHSGKRKLLGRFIGMWVPSLLAVALSSKASSIEHEVLDVVKH